MRAILFLIMGHILVPVFAETTSTEIPKDIEKFLNEDGASIPKVKKETIGEPVEIAPKPDLSEAEINAQLQAEMNTKVPPKALQITELFSVNENPGEGSLMFLKGEGSETISLGAQSGHYGLGLVFDSAVLPQPHRHEFGRKKIIQVVFGTMASKLQGRVPQFGMLTLFARDLPKFSKVYRFRLKPTGSRGTKVRAGAVMLFNSPNAKQSQSDEDKLRGTFFARAGTLEVRPIGSAKTASTTIEGQRLKFKARLMEFQILSKLVTPFNNQSKFGLQGTVTFPVYWPANKLAREFTNILALESLSDSPIPAQPNRKVSGSQSKKK